MAPARQVFVNIRKILEAAGTSFVGYAKQMVDVAPSC